MKYLKCVVIKIETMNFKLKFPFIINYIKIYINIKLFEI